MTRTFTHAAGKKWIRLHKMKRNSGGIAHKVPIHMGLTGLSLPKNYSTCSKSQSKDAGIIDHFFTSIELCVVFVSQCDKRFRFLSISIASNCGAAMDEGKISRDV